MIAMPETLQETIARLVKEMSTPKAEKPLVDDAQVQQRMVALASAGYIPSAQVTEAVRTYMSGYGVLLSGSVGIGKTFLMKSLGVRLYKADDIADYGLNRIHNWYEWTDGHELCIDDLGTERVVAEFGAKDDVMKAVIAHRCEGQKARTHFTTNLTGKQIAERYGDRTISRLLGMCKAFKFTGDSKRTAMPVENGGEL
jgi:DNA replication protein DnaC